MPYQFYVFIPFLSWQWPIVGSSQKRIEVTSMFNVIIENVIWEQLNTLVYAFLES